MHDHFVYATEPPEITKLHRQFGRPYPTNPTNPLGKLFIQIQSRQFNGFPSEFEPLFVHVYPPARRVSLPFAWYTRWPSIVLYTEKHRGTQAVRTNHAKTNRRLLPILPSIKSPSRTQEQADNYYGSVK